MKRKVSLILMAGVLAFAGLGFAGIYTVGAYDLDISMTKPNANQSLDYFDVQLNATFTFSDKELGMMLMNKTTSGLKIDWDMVSFIDPSAKAFKLFKKGTSYINKDEPQKATLIPPSSKISNAFIPADNIVYDLGNNKWSIKDLFGTSDLTALTGKTFSVYLPVEFGAAKKEYMFTFTINSAKVSASAAAPIEELDGPAKPVKAKNSSSDDEDEEDESAPKKVAKPKPAPKASSSDDDEDEEDEPAPKKVAKPKPAPKASSSDDDEDEEDEPAPKKVAKPKPAPKASSSDDDEDEEDEPAPKKVAKPKPAPKASSSDDDEDEEDEPAPKKVAKPKPAPKASSSDDDEDEEDEPAPKKVAKPKPAPKASSSDDEEEE